MTRLRALAVFAVAFAILAILAGADLLRPSANNHYSHMAQGWLEGRLTLAGNPPGWPRAHDDWGRVHTLQLRDGSVLRGFPCRTRACTERRRQERVETFFTTTGETREIPLAQVVRRGGDWYVTFPPGPALVILPGVALWGLQFPDILFTVLVGALIPVLLLRVFARARPGRTREHLLACVAWTLASPACFVAAHGSVWFTAQVLADMFLVLHIGAAWNAAQPARAGLWLGMAAACRPQLAFAAPFFLLEWWREGKKPAVLLRFAAPLLLIGAALAIFNWVRFDNPFEFGHRYLEIRWQERIQTWGMFSTHYLWRNVQCLLWLWPQIHLSPWSVRWSIHGMGLLFGSPWLLCLLGARDPLPQRRGLWLAALAVAVPALLYQNSGQIQFSYRFALDFLPFLLILLVAGGGARSRWFLPLV
ncbi:MAG TPA: hypothetical protein VIK91_22735, partial [Nannocystis sp.]